LSKLQLVDAAVMERLLFSLGFVRTRQKGSHAFYRHDDGRTTTLPHHKGRTMSRPLLREILKDIDISPDEYAAFLEKL
jgi:predicted RNA binding protein YcfA (HicA-like mRNA interferase family)